MLSTHAHAAKLIRTELKHHGVKSKVRAESYTGGDSVRVAVYNQPPWVLAAIKSFCSQYQKGHFNGMEDIYEYSNRRGDVPQVKFVFVENEFSDELRQQAYSYLHTNFGGYENLSSEYADNINKQGMTDWVSTEVHQVLSGAMDRRSSGIKYWRKPHTKLAA